MKQSKTAKVSLRTDPNLSRKVLKAGQKAGKHSENTAWEHCAEVGANITLAQTLKEVAESREVITLLRNGNSNMPLGLANHIAESLEEDIELSEQATDLISNQNKDKK